MAHLLIPAVLVGLPDSALVHLGLIVNHVGADDPLARLSKLGFMWVQYVRLSGDAVHVISLRRANQRERTRYARQAKPRAD